MSYEVGMQVKDEFFLVKSVKEFSWGVIGTLTNNAEGDISFKFGNEKIAGQIEVGTVICVDGVVAEYNGAPQVTGYADSVNLTEDILRKVVPVAPIDIDTEFAFLVDTVASVSDAELRNITSALLEEYVEKLSRMPAGKAMHHAYIGGWVEHTAGILRSALALCDVYSGKLNKDLLVCGAVLHDVGKALEFNLTDLGLVKEYSFLGDGVGHASLGVGLITAKAVESGYGLTSPSIAALLNIVGTHAGRREWGACADPVTREAIVISNLDYVDAHLNTASSALKDTACGERGSSNPMRCAFYQTLPNP